MNYYLDTEFLEGNQKKLFRSTKPTIDLISIGIVAEDCREYYAISKDFNLKEAWNRYDEVPEEVDGSYKKIYWLRENVLKPIFLDLCNIENGISKSSVKINGENFTGHDFTYKNFKRLLNKHGKANKEIAKEIIDFIKSEPLKMKGSKGTIILSDESAHNIRRGYLEPKFYGYYADYDWVVFCWLFGRMIDLPEGFPMYCRDLKQLLDEKADIYVENKIKEPIVSSDWYGDYCVDELKRHPNYPKQENKHNALADAKWNKKLHEFLKEIN